MMILIMMTAIIVSIQMYIYFKRNAASFEKIAIYC